ncbi:putative ORFan [Tupanvirus deep ocean]|uniref:ORFan n=2 Tax=Tupanvirus TaxID=2094720 RepID=A0AC62A9U5_9VIRU|nr:putative ORFan [Tupanvirus deep ocean]QKU34552.1 putative ORFan [Tupanvirus deep ocean]
MNNIVPEKIVELTRKDVVLPKPSDNHTRSLVTETTNNFYIVPNAGDPESNNVHVYSGPRRKVTYWSW